MSPGCEMNRYNIYFLDWKNSLATLRYQELSNRYPNVYRVNMQDNLVDTFKALAGLSNVEYFWIVSSLTEYQHFNFEDYSEMGLEPYTQVFGANTWFTSRTAVEKFGNVRYVEALPRLHFHTTALKPDSVLLDIVYISNGEPLAEKHYQHLVETAKRGNKIHRIDGVNGRTAAYQAAANASTTAWFFAVFAKIEVNPDFNWTWQPDPIKGPSHYIFHALNPVNGLEYGHMAVVAYNKMLTLSTQQTGLDFIMTKPHSVFPMLSGVAYYNQDAITTWRTAFREVVKLKKFLEQNPGDVETLFRLEQWTAHRTGELAEWSTQGAEDAVEYFDEVDGDYDSIKLSYDWEWLDQYFKSRYS